MALGAAVMTANPATKPVNPYSKKKNLNPIIDNCKYDIFNEERVHAIYSQD